MLALSETSSLSQSMQLLSSLLKSSQKFIIFLRSSQISNSRICFRLAFQKKKTCPFFSCRQVWNTPGRTGSWWRARPSRPSCCCAASARRGPPGWSRWICITRRRRPSAPRFFSLFWEGWGWKNGSFKICLAFSSYRLEDETSEIISKEKHKYWRWWWEKNPLNWLVKRIEVLRAWSWMSWVQMRGWREMWKLLTTSHHTIWNPKEKKQDVKNVLSEENNWVIL